MPQTQGISTSAAGRLDGSLQVTTALVANFSLGVGWGSTATASLLAGSTDQRGRLTITSSGTGQAQATATVTHVFADGAYAAAPFPFHTTTNTTAIDTGHLVMTTTTTQSVWTFSVLPVAAGVYIINYAYIA